MPRGRILFSWIPRPCSLESRAGLPRSSGAEPGYTPAARKAKIEGEVALSIVIDAQGNVTEVKQTSDPLGEGLDESAAATVRTWKFEPARRDGVPVAVKTLVKITF